MRNLLTGRALAIAAITVAVLGLGASVLRADLAAGRIATDFPSYAGPGMFPFPDVSPFAVGITLVGLLGWAALLVAVGVTRPRLGIVAWLIVAAAGVAGAALSLAYARSTVCCAYSLSILEGYPYPWRSHNLLSDNPLSRTELNELLHTSPGEFSHRVMPLYLALDALFWASVAMLLVLPARWALRLVSRDRVPATSA